MKLFQHCQKKDLSLKVREEAMQIIPIHDEVARGTLKSILLQAGIELDEFLKLL